MRVTPYRVVFASEQLLGPVDGPLSRGCRVSTLHHGYQVATLGEYVLLPTGRLKGRAALTADLRRGWRGFESTHDPDDPDQGDVPEICRRLAPGLPLPVITESSDWGDVLAHLDTGKAVSIALKLSRLPASSPLRKYTAAAHQVLIYGRRNGDTLLVDPMHPPSDTYRGEWVPLGDVRQAAEGFGKFYFELFPIGGFTQEKLATKDLRAALAASDRRIERLTDRNDELTTKVGTLTVENAILKAQSASAEEAAEAAHVALLDELHEWEVAQRA
jgi:hypothetical protein